MSFDLIGNKGHQVLSQRRIPFIKATKSSTEFECINYIENSKQPPVTKKSDLSSIGLFDLEKALQYVNWINIGRVGPGFFNTGNSCFLNSTLQCLVHTPALSQVLCRDAKDALKNMSTRNSVVSNFQK